VTSCGIKTGKEWSWEKIKECGKVKLQKRKERGTKESSKVWLGPDDEEMTQRGNKLTRPLDREEPEEIGRDRSESVASNGEGGPGYDEGGGGPEEIRIKDVGRKVEFPKQPFSCLPILSSILAFLAFTNMSNHFNRTQRQNAASANYESVIQRGSHGSPSRRLLPLPLSSCRRRSLEDCGSDALRSWSSSRPYPSIQDIANRARSNQMQHDTFSDLYLGDLIFASAITVEELLAPQRS